MDVYDPLTTTIFFKLSFSIYPPKNIFPLWKIFSLQAEYLHFLIYFNKQGAVSKPLIKSDDEIASPFGVMLSIQMPDFFNVQFCS